MSGENQSNTSAPSIVPRFDGSVAILILLACYVGLYVILSVWISIEGFKTYLWTDHVPNRSVVGAMAMLGGWSAKVLSLMNFLFGLGGGFFISHGPTSRFNRTLKRIIFAACLVLMIVSLADLLLVAFSASDIKSNVLTMRGNLATVPDAITAIGLIHLSIVSGFLAGMAVTQLPNQSGAPA